MLHYLTEIIGSEAGRTIVLPLTIILFATFFEDATTIVVALLAADQVIPIKVALPFLYLGVTLGDFMFYSLGWLARTHPRLKQFVDNDFTAPVRAWLDSHYALSIFSARFIPGLRSTMYIASGFFRYPLRVYIPAAMSGGIVLVGALFSVTYWLGTAHWLKELRWVIAIAVLAVMFFVGRRNLELFRSRQAKDVTGQSNAS